MPATYSDNKYIYSVDMMFAYLNIKHPKHKKVPVKSLLKNLEYKGWGDPNIKKRHSAMDVLKNKKKYKEDYDRIKNADLSYPIILTHQGYIVDGMHRLTKAVLKKKKDIKIYTFDKKLMDKFIIGKVGQWDKVDKIQIYEFLMMFNRRFS